MTEPTIGDIRDLACRTDLAYLAIEALHHHIAGRNVVDPPRDLRLVQGGAK